VLARVRSPGSGRNDRMCAAQKAGFAVTEAKNANPSWRAAYWSPGGLAAVVDGPGGGVAAGGPARRGDRMVLARVVAHVLQVRKDQREYRGQQVLVIADRGPAGRGGRRDPQDGTAADRGDAGRP
jgi:hypothetical protein